MSNAKPAMYSLLLQSWGLARKTAVIHRAASGQRESHVRHSHVEIKLHVQQKEAA